MRRLQYGAAGGKNRNQATGCRIYHRRRCHLWQSVMQQADLQRQRRQPQPHRPIHIDNKHPELRAVRGRVLSYEHLMPWVWAARDDGHHQVELAYMKPPQPGRGRG